MNVIFKVICQAEEKYKELLNTQNKKESRILLKKLLFFQERIKEDITYGDIIKKVALQKNKNILNSFFEGHNYPDLFDLDNCFCCDLTRTDWRMLYTLVRDSIEDVCYILCFMIVNHKKYEKYFT